MIEGVNDNGAWLRPLCDLRMAQVRDTAGRHEYDGRIPDLSRDAVAVAVASLGGAPLVDQHDEAHLCAEDPVDLEHQARTERDRLHAVLEETSALMKPGHPADRLVPVLMEDHPSSDGVLAEA
jgi:hypothetical protein